MDLTVRAYNVGFGDAVLVSIPESGGNGAETVRHLLIDVGNLLAGKANEDTVFNAVVADIARVTKGEVDLYVMTHEHLDHTQGLLAAANAGISLKAKHAWLTGSAAEDYYDTHENAKKQRLGDQASFLDVAVQHNADADPWLEMMILNNSALLPEGAFGLKTSDYVDHLRDIAPKKKTYYVDRTTRLKGKHPFKEAKLRVLAPEEDTAAYYGRRPSAPAFTLEPEGSLSASTMPVPVPAIPPVGVDAGAFFDLVASRRSLNHRTIMEIDAAANNTSIVLEITWRGWKLLFPGDAEERSWQTMHDGGLLEPVHFIKVSHHGSVNGTDPDVLDAVLPETPPDRRKRRAVVSTHTGDWVTVPDADTLGLYDERCELLDTRSVARGEPVKIVFSGD